MRGKGRTISVYPVDTLKVISVEEAKSAIEKARQIKAFVMKKVEELGYYQ
mgnify:CR=1 FL=1